MFRIVVDAPIGGVKVLSHGSGSARYFIHEKYKSDMVKYESKRAAESTLRSMVKYGTAPDGAYVL